MAEPRAMVELPTNTTFKAGDQRGISVSYYPGGTGPEVSGRGGLRLSYHDSAHVLAFYGSEVRTVESDIGTIVSVTTVQTVDIGSTTFGLLVPLVVLPADSNSPIPIETIGITTAQRLLASAIGHPQREAYTATSVRGTVTPDSSPCRGASLHAGNRPIPMNQPA